MERVLYLPANNDGRDFVVGDIHGCFWLLEHAMELVDFDPSVDRIITPGDMVDRGDQSVLFLDFLEKPWFYSTRGNHEDSVLAMFRPGRNYIRFSPAELDKFYSADSKAWLRKLPRTMETDVCDAIERLPIAIQVDHQSGPIGFVHGDVPKGLNWQQFLEKVEADDPKVIAAALMGRTRALHADSPGVDGAARIFFGHTAGDKVRQRGNCFFLDTGAVFKHFNENHTYAAPLADAHLTLAQVDLRDEFYMRARRVDTGIVNAIAGRPQGVTDVSAKTQAREPAHMITPAMA